MFLRQTEGHGVSLTAAGVFRINRTSGLVVSALSLIKRNKANTNSIMHSAPASCFNPSYAARRKNPPIEDYKQKIRSQYNLAQNPKPIAFKIMPLSGGVSPTLNTCEEPLIYRSSLVGFYFHHLCQIIFN